MLPHKMEYSIHLCTYQRFYTAESSNTSHPWAFYTYSRMGSRPNPPIVEVVCAMLSFPFLFSPTAIGPRLRQQQFAGSPVGTSNPIRELLKEAVTIFGQDRRVCQILSLGSDRVLEILSQYYTQQKADSQKGCYIVSTCMANSHRFIGKEPVHEMAARNPYICFWRHKCNKTSGKWEGNRFIRWTWVCR